MENHLIVKNSRLENVGIGMVVINFLRSKELHLKNGDIIEINYSKTNRKTAAVLKIEQSDEINSNFIEIDPAIRRNLGAIIGDRVQIWSAKATLAKKIILKKLGKKIILKNPSRLAYKLKSRVFMIGDIISFHSPIGKVEFLIEGFEPDGDITFVNKDTRFILNNSFEQFH